MLIEEKPYQPYICLDEKGNPSRKCIGGWTYHVSDYSPEYNVEFVKKKKWNYVLLSASVTKSIIDYI